MSLTRKELQELVEAAGIIVLYTFPDEKGGHTVESGQMRRLENALKPFHAIEDARVAQEVIDDYLTDGQLQDIGALL